MITSTKSLGVTFVICLTSSLLVTPDLAAQGRMGAMQTMAMPRPFMPGQTMSGQMMPSVPSMSPGFNPNLGIGNLNGFGTPLWNTNGLYGLGGIYGLGSLLGTGGYPVGAASPPVAPAGSGGNAPDPAAARDKAATRREKIESERLANQLKRLDEMLYERDLAIQNEHRRSRENPTRTEIVSGKALNDLLDDFRKLGMNLDSANGSNALLPLDKSELQHINVTRGMGNIALLKHGGQLNWPSAFAIEEFRTARERVSAQLSEIVGRLKSGSEADPAAIKQIKNDVEGIQTMLRRKAGELSIEPFVEAKRFLQGLNDSLVALQQPDAANYFTSQSALTAQSVLGLVKYMNDHGLRFAAAAPGDESAYVALRDALATCYRANQPK
jgi:hypothetical protein